MNKNKNNYQPSIDKDNYFSFAGNGVDLSADTKFDRNEDIKKIVSTSKITTDKVQIKISTVFTKK